MRPGQGHGHKKWHKQEEINGAPKYMAGIKKQQPWLKSFACKRKRFCRASANKTDYINPYVTHVDLKSIVPKTITNLAQM